ncbi:MAG TPA: TIM barrel protein [Anaerolineales bacterium]|nr:TIM barrel protein [Anaerolineales bacterium]
MPSPGDIAYAPNISWLLPELPSGERPHVLAHAGFGAIEFGFPSQVDVEAVDEARQEYGLEVALFNQDIPVWDRRNRGYLSDPSRREEFRRRLDEALVLARRLRAGCVMLPAGVELPGMDRARQHDLVLENLREAAPLAADAGVRLTVEVINPTDHPGYFLTSSREALEIVQQVGHPNVRFQFDTYHLFMVEGGLPELFARCAPWVGHIQFGDHPARCQPGTGTIDFSTVLEAIGASGYRGYIGLEFVPRDAGLAALAWVPESMRQRAASRNAHIPDHTEKPT